MIGGMLEMDGWMERGGLRMNSDEREAICRKVNFRRSLV